MWQAEADTELTLSASPAPAVGELALTMANRHYSTGASHHTVILDHKIHQKGHFSLHTLAL